MEHNLEKSEGGVVELPSGSWQWFAIRIYAMPEHECVSSLIVFTSRDHRGSLMRATAPADLATISDEQVHELGLHPSYRRIETPRGVFEVQPPSKHLPEQAWRITGPGNSRPRLDMQGDPPLGAITHDRLIEIVHMASA